jgi:hypothetical protein
MFNLKQYQQLAFLAEAGVEITVLSIDRYRVEGFYKSGSVTVDFTKMEITARYNEVTQFTEDEDLAIVLADLNRAWQERSAYRAEFWEEPTTEWARVYNMLEMEEPYE